MKKLCFLLAAAIAPVFITGCSSGTKTVNEEAGEKGQTGATLTFEDCDKLVKGILTDLFKSQRLAKSDGSRYVMAIGKIDKDPGIDIDKDQILWNIKTELTNSGLVAVTSAIAAEKKDTSVLVQGSRQTRGDDEFNQSNVPQKGTLVAPDLTIDGKITHVRKRMDGGNMQVEYYVQLKITDLKTGLDFWQKQVRTVKYGDAKEIRATLGAP